MKIQEIIKAFAEMGSLEAEREAYLTVEYLFGVSYTAAICDRLREYDEVEVNGILEKRKQGSIDLAEDLGCEGTAMRRGNSMRFRRKKTNYIVSVFILCVYVYASSVQLVCRNAV